ncbi:uncharacterized protein [Apostichopus japonicus]
MIWGKTLDPGKLYTEVVHTDIHLSMAALESRGDRGAEYSGYSQVMLKTAEAEFLLCTLVHGMIFQQTLDVQLKKGEEISVYTEGKNKVHLTGYSICLGENLVSSVSGRTGRSNNQDGAALHSDSDSVASSQDGVHCPVIKTEYQESELEEFWQASRSESFTMAPLPCGTSDLMRWVELRNRTMDGVSNYGPRLEGVHEATRLNSYTLSHQRTSKNPEKDVTNSASVAELRQMLNQDSEDDISSGSEDERQPSSGREASSPNQDQIAALHQLKSPPITQRINAVVAQKAHQRTEESVQSRDLPPNSSYQRISEPVAASQVSPVLQLQAAMLQKASSQECSNHDEVVTLPIPAPVRGYQCQFCFKLFRHVSNFKSHQLIHTNLKPYKCRFCGVGFKQTGNLKAHERIHTGDRPYKCSYCGKQFARSTTRNTHEKLHTNSVTYRCNVCDRIFMHANSLKKHQMLHKT